MAEAEGNTPLLAPPGLARLAQHGAAALGTIQGAFAAERDRWFLFLPVLVGIGIGIYFSLTFEPPLRLGLVLAAAAFGLAVLARRRRRFIATATALAAIACGFAAAELQAWWVTAPILHHRIGPVIVVGRVAEAEPLAAGERLVIMPKQIGAMTQAELPARVRIKLRGGGSISGAMPVPGEGISLRAVLLPPPSPAMPGAYDFQRQAFFDRLGAVGYAIGAPVPVSGEAPSGWRVALADLRARVTARIMGSLSGPTGAIAAALITGETHAIPEPDAQAFRDAGLAHILVIAGLHMGLVAGLAFFALRALLALIPPVALRINTKKWAASLALLITFAYMLLSGATVSSRRSFLMTALVLLAILVDRLHVSVRGLAWAALIVMMASPVAVTGPSFQMSFAAVAGLAAFYETFRTPIAAWHSKAGPARRILLYLAGIVFTTLVSTIATAPFMVFHFNRFPLFSVAANVIAVPITGFWVMPWAMIACLLMPFGWESVALHPMGWGIDAIAAIAQAVTAWPGAVLAIPSMPAWGLALVSLGGFWLCAWRRRWRLLGLAPIMVGYLTLLIARPPDLLIDGESRIMAVRAADGSYLVSGGKPDGIVEETWARRAAAVQGSFWPETGTSPDGKLSCDSTTCLYHARGQTVALDRGSGRIAQDCSGADLVVTPLWTEASCGAIPIVDRHATEQNGSYAVWLEQPHIAIESVHDWRGDRPWTVEASAAPN